MESIEQPIFHPYGSDDKDELIDDPTPIGSRLAPTENSNANNSSDTSPVLAAKGLLSSGKETLANQNRGLWIIIICTIIFAIIITIALILTIYLVPKQISGHAAVATEVGKCSTIGLEMIKLGGNAVDAAVAAAFCLGVIHPQSSGIGGGGFLLYHDHKNQLSVAYDFRETAPANSLATMLDDVSGVDLNGKLVGIPGELKGLAVVHKEWGKLDWETLIEPSIDLAQLGFNVTKAFADSLVKHVTKSSMSSPGMANMAKIFAPGGQFLKHGDFLRRPDLARTLEIIKHDGPDAFYHGQLGKNFVTMVQRNQGVMDMADLQQYSVIRQNPVVSTFKGLEVLGMPAPSSGPVVALMLRMIEGFNWTKESKSDPKTYQQMIETFKFGFGHRSLLGDPANPEYTDDINNATKNFLSEAFASALRMKIDNRSHDYGPEIEPIQDFGTSHVSIIDPTEVMVSLTLTNNYWFGSKLMSDDGILANNEMLDFSASAGGEPPMPPNERNQVVPGMRPLSSMTPTIVYNKQHPCAQRIIVGASNGTRIITGVVETLVNALIFEMNIKDAVAYPRIHQQLFPSSATEYEDVKSASAPGREAVFPEDIRKALTEQEMVPVSEGLSCVQAIMKINDAVQAYSDWRKGGHADMF